MLRVFPFFVSLSLCWQTLWVFSVTGIIKINKSGFDKENREEKYLFSASQLKIFGREFFKIIKFRM